MGEIFRNIGERLVEFYSIIASMDSVGACVVNDDWGSRNSIPEFIPMDNYMAMLSAAADFSC